MFNVTVLNLFISIQFESDLSRRDSNTAEFYRGYRLEMNNNIDKVIH